MKYGIIFDMDGTLWDSTEEVALAWNQVVLKRGLTALTDQDLARVMGLPMDKLARGLFPRLEPRESYDLMDECVVVENEYLREHGAKLYPQVIEILKELKQDYPLYIVSNCQAGYIEAFLTHYGIGSLFEDIQCYGYNKKQKGENIRLVMERNGLEQAVYVGDIQGDYEASAEAGADFIHAAYGFGVLEKEIAKKVPAVQCFSELPATIKNLIQTQ